MTFGAVWFLLLLAPSSAVPLREPMAEHRVYLASVGVFLIAALGLVVRTHGTSHGKTTEIAAEDTTEEGVNGGETGRAAIQVQAPRRPGAEGAPGERVPERAGARR